LRVPARRSAGLLLYRRKAGAVEILIAHPGGPFWAKRDEGAWTIPKGLIEDGEAELDVARREFHEETGHPAPVEGTFPLGDIQLRSGKAVAGWAAEGDLDPSAARSNLATVEWPPRSGRQIRVPEIDRVAWVSPDAARRLLNPAQAAFVDRLLVALERA
ncbi:MAG TPA: NUDIX domain-containing protein, partial [Candidatus Limnocylindrales bacterium]|nr:NUDIX domain-containing protein [Candidatus Limnocylindrales bacterium]